MELLGYYLSMLETDHDRRRMSDAYDAYQKTCLFVAMSHLDDEWLAEDAVHNAFMNLIEKKELLALPDHRLKATLLSIVRKRSIDIFRQKTRQKTENLDDMTSMPSSEKPIEIQVTSSLDIERMAEQLRILDEPYRGILQLKYFAELSNTKIGEYLGLTNRQVETHVYYAKQKLRKSFTQSYPDDDNLEVANNA